MKNEDGTVEILSEILIASEEINKRLSKLESEQKETSTRLGSLEDDTHISRVLLKHHENWLRHISGLLESDVPKFDKVLEIENLEDGRSILHKA
ncbi:MAG: hypothetical protein AAF600_00165 [Bacteroidota bacterium]